MHVQAQELWMGTWDSALMEDADVAFPWATL